MSNQPSTTVYKLDELRWEANYSLPPRKAVRNAYAQFDRHDYDTWNYAQYDNLVQEGHFTVSCGDFVAWKKGKPTAEEVHQYVEANDIKAQSARDAQS